MQKIFKVKDEIETKIIGRSFPQVVDSDCDLLFEENEKFNEDEKFISISKEEFSIRISKSTKLTDSLSSFMTNQSPIVSQKLADLISRFKTSSYKLIPIKVFRGKEEMVEKKYFIMHFYGNDISSINFNKSTFDYLSGGALLDKSLLKFDSYEDYMTKLNSNKVKMAIIQKVVMKPTLANAIFFLGIFDGAARYVTQSLKEVMEGEGISGFNYVEVGYIED